MKKLITFILCAVLLAGNSTTVCYEELPPGLVSSSFALRALERKIAGVIALPNHALHRDVPALLKRIFAAQVPLEYRKESFEQIQQKLESAKDMFAQKAEWRTWYIAKYLVTGTVGLGLSVVWRIVFKEHSPFWYMVCGSFVVFSFFSVHKQYVQYTPEKCKHSIDSLNTIGWYLEQYKGQETMQKKG